MRPSFPSRLCRTFLFFRIIIVQKAFTVFFFLEAPLSISLDDSPCTNNDQRGSFWLSLLLRPLCYKVVSGASFKSSSCFFRSWPSFPSSRLANNFSRYTVPYPMALSFRFFKRPRKTRSTHPFPPILSVPLLCIVPFLEVP